MTTCKVAKILSDNKEFFESVDIGDMSVNFRMGKTIVTFAIHKKNDGVYQCTLRHHGAVSLVSQETKVYDDLLNNLSVQANTSNLKFIKDLLNASSFEEFMMEYALSDGEWRISDVGTIENLYRRINTDPTVLVRSTVALDAFIRSVMDIHFKRGSIRFSTVSHSHLTTPVIVSGNTSYNNTNSVSLCAVLTSKLKIGMYDHKNDVLYRIICHANQEIEIVKYTKYNAHSIQFKLDYQISRY